MVKKIVLIGPGCYFSDSFVYFQEQGIKVYVLKVARNTPWEENNYELYSELGFCILSTEDAKNMEDLFAKIHADENTVFIGGGFYGGEIPVLHRCLNGRDTDQLELLYKISKFNKERNIKAICVRYFNGDTGFGSQKQLDYFAEKTQDLDVLLFDNEELREFVLYNIPSLESKRNYICQLEKPLKRFVKIDQTQVKKRFALLGRFISTVKPNLEEKNVLSFPINKKLFGVSYYNKFYFLAGYNSLKRITRDRQKFAKKYRSSAFGLSHFYDALSGTKEFFRKKKQLSYSLEGQKMIFLPKGYNPFQEIAYHHPIYYGYTNTASKDLNYLMYGIIPVFAHSMNSFYKNLVAKNMAIEIESHQNLVDLLDMDNSEILKIRKNIANNVDVFTFENEAESLLAYLNSNDSRYCFSEKITLN